MILLVFSLCPSGEERVKALSALNNRFTADLRACITGAAAKIGSDDKGAGGVEGFLEALGRENKAALTALLGKLLPPAPKPARICRPDEGSGSS